MIFKGCPECDRGWTWHYTNKASGEMITRNQFNSKLEEISGDYTDEEFSVFMIDFLKHGEVSNIPEGYKKSLSFKEEWIESEMYRCECTMNPDELLAGKLLESRGRVVTKEMCEDLSRNKIISDKIFYLATGPIAECLFLGKSGEGKSLILKNWYNRIAYGLKSIREMFYISETEISKLFRESEQAEEVIQRIMSCKYFFLDEIGSRENWKDKTDGTNRDKAVLALQNYSDFLDKLYNRGSHIKCFGAGNNYKQEGDDILVDLGKEVDHTGKMTRRISEIFKRTVIV